MSQSVFSNKRILLTAGPTREAIDPVRYISNHSSGKMGYAIAEKLLALGATVYLVSGPVNISLSHPKLTLVQVVSAADMYLACCHYFEEVDIAIFSAAVADYRPAKVAEQKIKKDTRNFTIQLVKNVDIAAEFGKIKKSHQLSVGFALETEHERQHACAKLARKNFDLVVLNSMNDAGATFGHDTNRVTVIRSDFSTIRYPLKSKLAVADDILHELATIIGVKEIKEMEAITADYEMMYA